MAIMIEDLLWLFLFTCAGCAGLNESHSSVQHQLNNYTTEIIKCGSPYLSLDTSCSLPWSYCAKDGVCACANATADIHCHMEEPGTETGTSLVSYGYCVTYNRSTAITELGRCVYNGGIRKSNDTSLLYATLPPNVTELDDYLCGPYNRTGTLCGRCKDNYHPLAYSFDMNCVNCPNARSNWWKFILAAFLPLTCFYFVVLLFQISVTSSHFHGFIYCSQGIAIPSVVRVALLYARGKEELETAVRVVGNFYGIWNLDFFRCVDLGICLSTDTLTTLALDIAVGVYPLLLMLITFLLIQLHDRHFTPLVIIWKPFKAVFGLFHENWDIGTSLIDAFTTFFLLSSVKFMSVAFDLLVPIDINQLHSTGERSIVWHLYYDATVPYFGQKHIIYAVLAIVTLLLFLVLPAVLLLFYPFACFQKLLNLLPIRRDILHNIMDSFQGCYKDGTQPGTRDYRWLSFVFYFSRFILLLIGALTLNSMFFPMAAMLMAVIAILLITLEPFKTRVGRYSDTNALFVLLLGLWYVTILGVNHSAIRQPDLVYVFAACTFAVALLPLFYMSVIVLHWLYSHRKFGRDLLEKYHAWRRGYEILN